MAGEENALLAPELMARVRQIQIRTHRLVNDVLSGAYRSTFRGTGIEFEEVRPYQPGDEVRSIDWNRKLFEDLSPMHGTLRMCLHRGSLPNTWAEEAKFSEVSDLHTNLGSQYTGPRPRANYKMVH